MLKEMLIIVLMAIIGGIIGSMTNFIAIRMLFRPYKPLYIGKLRLPFTPGLIPKRQDELAEKISQVIMGYLLTEETITNKLNSPALQAELIQSGQRFFDEKMKGEITIRNWLSKRGFSNGSNSLQKELESAIKAYLYEKKEQKLGDTMPHALSQFIEAKLPHLAETIIKRLEIYAKSENGNKQIEQLLLNFFNEHGKLGVLLKTFISVPSLTEKVQKEAEAFLSAPDTRRMVEQMIQSEWQQLKNRKIESLLSPSQNELIATQFAREVFRTIQGKHFLDKSIQSFLKKYQSTIRHKWIPYGVNQTLTFLAKNHGYILSKLDPADLIRRKIATFSLAEVEKIVLEISGKELKMITYLGGVLGALIGIVQGILAIFI